jgi:hypothetical protein
MAEHPDQVPLLLDSFMKRAWLEGAAATLRTEGTRRTMGRLRVGGFQAGQAILLLGPTVRDRLPEAGTGLLCSVLLEETLLAFPSRVLGPAAGPGGPPFLRVAWPEAFRFMGWKEGDLFLLPLRLATARMGGQAQGRGDAPPPGTPPAEPVG